jgi:hypothetical protein
MKVRFTLIFWFLFHLRKKGLALVPAMRDGKAEGWAYTPIKE